MNSSSLRVISLSMLTTLLLTFSGCGNSSGCCPDLNKVEGSTQQSIQTLAVEEEPAIVADEAQKAKEEPNKTVIAVNQAPVSVINGITSPNGQLGSILLVNGFSSQDDVKIKNYKWTINNKIISTSEKAEIPLEQPGKYTICLEVEDEENLKNQTCETVVVPQPAEVPIKNTPPVAVMSGINSAQAKVGDILSVDGSLSSDDNNITSYKWSVNGLVISNQEKTDITLDKPGSYNICLDVTDASNATNQTCKVVVVPQPAQVVNIPPKAVISGINSTEAKVGDILAVNGSLSSDDNNVTSYQWSVNGLVVSDQEMTNITLDKPGLYNICLDVTDASNATNQVCKRVNVPTPPIVLSAPPKAVITGVIDNEQRAPGTVTVSGTTSSDDIGVVSYQWSVDDINTSTQPTTTIDLNIPSSKICLTVTDADKQTNQTCKNIIVVAPSLPKAVVSGLDGITIKTGCPIIVSANGSSSTNGAISSYSWLLDGTEVATTQDINISVATEGTHQLCLNVTDSTGSVSEDNCQNIVVNPHVPPTPKLVLLDSSGAPVTNKILIKSTKYNLSCAGSKDDCNRDVTECKWNATSYLLNADGTKTPYIVNCFDDAEHSGHGPAITTTLTPSNITLCGSTNKFNTVEVTLTVTDVLGNTKTITEAYTVNP